MPFVNPLKQKWADGKAVVNGWISAPGILSAEIMARAGWDCITIDMQHGTADYRDLLSILPVLGQTDTPALVRVPWNRPEDIMRALDAGAVGIIAPMIENADDARALVEACLYAPDGARSFGPIRARLAYGNSYARDANQNILPIAMIETKSALDDLDAILQVEGLGAVYIGPADLSLVHGFPPGFDREEPEMLALLSHILAQATKFGVPAGIHCGTPAYAKRMVAMGFQLVTVGSDMRFMEAGIAQALVEMRAP
ncbi:HpcH/HpaI aldolase/citrate lyase family protein [Falsihalocynthiibacter sp. S25ZX9]|uniref:HpcH/HpaI aldolase family protein n=1 Tax=Falsihalocynthiibacter sp. S25ZX9 TaxID=3240870 RepID=UPI00350FA467